MDRYQVTIDVNHNIYLQRTVIITSAYNGQLPSDMLTLEGYHNIYLQLTVTITSTYNGQLP